MLGNTEARKTIYVRNSRLTRTGVTFILVGARRALANTPVNRWKVATTLKQRLFQFAYGSEEQTVQFRGMRLRVPGDDASSVPGLVAGYYESTSLDLFELLARSAQIIVDIGGGFGVYAIAAANATNGEGLIACFEPEVDNYELIAENLVNNRIPNVRLSAEAISNESGNGLLYIQSRNSGGSSLTATRGSTGSAQPVALTTLDDYCSRNGLLNIDLAKIDVEGHEIDVLRGATRVLDTHPSLLIEFAADVTLRAGRRLEDVSEFLSEYYDQFLVIDEVRHRTKWAEATDLVHLARSRASLNVLAIQRPDHLALVREQVGK